jgi:hypothetical protein
VFVACLLPAPTVVIIEPIVALQAPGADEVPAKSRWWRLGRKTGLLGSLWLLLGLKSSGEDVVHVIQHPPNVARSPPVAELSEKLPHIIEFNQRTHKMTTPN